jgi:hypothetical protein
MKYWTRSLEEPASPPQGGELAGCTAGTQVQLQHNLTLDNAACGALDANQVTEADVVSGDVATLGTATEGQRRNHLVVQTTDGTVAGR